MPSASSTGVAQLRGAQDELGSRARPGVESNPVWTIPELVPLAARPGSGSASSTVTRGAAPGQRQRHGGADHTRADHPDLGVHAATLRAGLGSRNHAAEVP